MSTTTPAAVATLIADRIADIVPSLHSNVPFRRHREETPFRDWILANPAGCLRRFSVRQAPSISPPDVTDGLTELVRQEFEVAIAYPSDGRFTQANQPALKLVDLDNAVERDRSQIAKTVGTNGYATYAASLPAATVITVGEERDDLGPVVVGVVRLEAIYYREATP